MSKPMTANRGASITRTNIVSKLRRVRSRYPNSVAYAVLTDLIEWVNQSCKRANKRPGGLGK